MRTLASGIHCGCYIQIHIHTDYRNPVEEKGGYVAALQVRERAPDPRLDRLLLFFWAHYIEGDPHLLCTGSPQVITF